MTLLCFHPTCSLQPRCSNDPPPTPDRSPATSPTTVPATSATPPRRPRALPPLYSGPVSVVVMRHGMTDWNYMGRVQGVLDKSRLNSTGMRQARLAGLSLRNISADGIFCSPLSRAKDTLYLAALESGNPSIMGRRPEVLKYLEEIRVPWQGMLKNEIPWSRFRDAYEVFHKNPKTFSLDGFNPIQDVLRRATEVWETVSRARGSCHLVIGHNQMNKALICTALGVHTNFAAWRQDNCCFNVVMLEEGKATKLRLVNGGPKLDRQEGSALKGLYRFRLGCVRIFLHQVGGWKGLETEIKRAGKGPEAFYLIGDVTEESIGTHITTRLGMTSTHLPCDVTGDEDLYHYAQSVIEVLRKQHEKGCIVISVKDSTTLRAFFAASLGLPSSVMKNLQSDPGGVSIVDVRATEPLGTHVSYAEAYNVGAWMQPDYLFGYTVTGENEASREQI